MLRPFGDPKVQAVTGCVLSANRTKNLLTRLIDLRYAYSFLGERAAYSLLGAVLCVPGAGGASLRGVVTAAGTASARATYLPTRGVGVVSNNLPLFDGRCGCRPSIAVHYVRWNVDPAVSQRLAEGMISYASSPLLELAPYGTTLSSITVGRDDRWLVSGLMAW